MKLKQVIVSAFIISLFVSPTLSFARISEDTNANNGGGQNPVLKTGSASGTLADIKKAAEEARKVAEEAKKAKSIADKKALEDAKALIDANAIKCVQTAMDKREDAISMSWSTYHPAITAALSARKTALHDSWAGVDAKTRITARKVAWEKYHKSVKEAESKLKSTKKTARVVFEKDTQECKLPVKDEAGKTDNI